MNRRLSSMNKTWNIDIWGVRGSFPVPDTHFLTYGGNTSCISLEYGNRLIILDAGSGIVPLGEHLHKCGRKRVDILLSHLHIDHVLGLFKFRLFYDPEAEIHLYGEYNSSTGLRKQLETLVGAPHWPVGISNFPAQIKIHELRPGETFILSEKADGKSSIKVHTLRGNHPQPSLLYRLEADNTSLVYALDCEMNEDMFRSLSAFSRGSSLIIWDANFTDQDLKQHSGWGHSSWKEGVSLCSAAEIEKF